MKRVSGTTANPTMESEKSIRRSHPDDIGSDSEDEQVLQDARNSAEVAEYDRQLLLEEEEKEELLTEKRPESHRASFRRKGRGEDSSDGHSGKISRPRAHKARRRRHSRRTDEAGELLYEMEEGGAKDDASSQASSSSMDEPRTERRDSSQVGQISH